MALDRHVGQRLVEMSKRFSGALIEVSELCQRWALDF